MPLFGLQFRKANAVLLLPDRRKVVTIAALLCVSGWAPYLFDVMLLI